MSGLPGWRSAWQAFLPVPAGPDAPLCWIAFDTAAFDATAFTQAGIAYPPSLARSVRKRQAEFFFGRLAARTAVTSLGRPAVDLPIGPLGAPVWPYGLKGSISHCAGLAVATALDTASVLGVGIDIEHVLEDEHRRDVLSTTVDDAELAMLESLQPCGLSMNTLLTLVFSAKESLYKGASGRVGRFFDFSAARFSSLDPVRQRLELSIQEDLCAELRPGSTCIVDYAFVGAGTVFTSFLWSAPGGTQPALA